MARLVRFDVANGQVLQYEPSGDTSRALGRADVLINPDMSGIVTDSFDNWRVINIGVDGEGQGTGSVREMTANEMQIRDDRRKQDQVDVIDQQDRIDPVLGMIALKRVLKQNNPALHDALVAEYKSLAGL